MNKIMGALWKPGINGLGVRGFHCLPYRKRFEEAANNHDAEYDERGNWRDRREFDIIFLQSMIEKSVNTLQVTMAVVYYYAVRVFGWLYYRYNR